MKDGHVAPEVLSAWADGEATAEETCAAEAHAASCRSCREALAAFREAKAGLAGAVRHPMPRSLMSRLERRFTPAPWRARWAALLSRPVVWAPAGALAVAAALFFLSPEALPPETVSMEVLMASHARYQGEGLTPQADLHQAHFTAHVANEVAGE